MHTKKIDWKHRCAFSLHNFNARCKVRKSKALPTKKIDCYRQPERTTMSLRIWKGHECSQPLNIVKSIFALSFKKIDVSKYIFEICWRPRFLSDPLVVSCFFFVVISISDRFFQVDYNRTATASLLAYYHIFYILIRPFGTFLIYILFSYYDTTTTTPSCIRQKKIFSTNFDEATGMVYEPCFCSQ